MAKERKWASECQIEGVEIVAGLQQKIKLAKEQYDVLKKCGLDREAKELLPKIQELEAQKLRLVEEIDRNRLIGAKALLMCFCAADVCTVCADDFADVEHKISYGRIGKDNDFSAMMRGLASDFNKAVCMIDAGGSEPLSYYYADMADELVKRVKAVMEQTITEYMNTEKGRQYF